MHTGTIKSVLLDGSMLVVEILTTDERGENRTEFVPSETRPTMEALIAAFGSVRAAIGKEIEYDYTDYGTLAGFNTEEAVV
jgi:hypothetical protein